MTTSSPIRLGIIGAGIFMRDSHTPVIKQLHDKFDVKAIASRSIDSANTVANLYQHHVDTYDDIAELLSRDDIEAVDIALPIHIQHEVVKQALDASKHVISEKPVAPNLTIGKQFTDNIGLQDQQVWMVAENWRYEEAFHIAKAQIDKGIIGTPMLFHWAIHIGMNPSNKYFHTDWRRDGSFNGGFILDAGVHQMAGLRVVLGKVKSVQAIMSHQSGKLPPADNLAVSMEMDSGVIGTIAVTYHHGSAHRPRLNIVGTEGVLSVERDYIGIEKSGEDTQTVEIESYQSILREFEAFHRAIRHQQPHRNSYLEALQDVAIIEAFFESAESGNRVDVETII